MQFGCFQYEVFPERCGVLLRQFGEFGEFEEIRWKNVPKCGHLNEVRFECELSVDKPRGRVEGREKRRLVQWQEIRWKESVIQREKEKKIANGQR